MKHFRTAAWLRRIPAVLAVICAPALILTNGTSAYASSVVDGAVLPYPSGCIPGISWNCTVAPSVYPYAPNVFEDCRTTAGQSEWSESTYLGNYHYTRRQNPTCSFKPRTTVIDWLPPIQKSTIINRCRNSSPASFSSTYMHTVSTMVQDMNGVQVTFKAEAELPKSLKAGIDISYQYQHTVATINATSIGDTKNLGIDPYTAGYLVFQPRIVRATGTLFALYPKYTHGLNGWFSGTGIDGPSHHDITTTNPLLTPDGEADGQWYVQDVPCSTLP